MVVIKKNIYISIGIFVVEKQLKFTNYCLFDGINLIDDKWIKYAYFYFTIFEKIGLETNFYHLR